jgi:hypothetical protein
LGIGLPFGRLNDGLRFGFRIGDVLFGEHSPEGPETFQFFDGAAVEALGVRLVAEEHGPVGRVAI